MTRFKFRRETVLCIVLAGACAVAPRALKPSSGDPSYAVLRHSFEKPPDDCRILMRWWWFGAAVTKPELERELQAMKQSGIGGFEVQPVYPLALDDPKLGLHNLPYLSPEFLDALRFVSQRASELGLRMDLTLASGWPYGGPHIPITLASGKLRIEHAALTSGVRSIPAPALSVGEQPIAAFLVNSSRISGMLTLQDARRIAWGGEDRLQLPDMAQADNTVLFFISSRTGMQVKRPAIGAEGFVLDHYNRAGIENHLAVVGEKLLSVLRPNLPYSVFSDSLEVYGSDWTPEFLTEFRRRRGYDLTPFLPALAEHSSDPAAVRHDWGKTLTELAEENYLVPIERWAKAHGTRFRSQTYGAPPVILSSNALVDLPEGEEGPKWRTFSAARWAASAGHLYGRPVISSETWTWLHSPAFRATPLDMKAEADRHFLQGINQLVGHGWPYSPQMAGEPGWAFYAAGAFNNHNPWWIVMPDIAKYLQRVSYLLRQGKPANDIALYLPTDDAWARFKPGSDAVDASMPALLGREVIPQILNAGYNFDFVDDRAVAHAGLPYRILILPGVKRIPLVTYRNVAEFARKGGIVIATRSTPSTAPGLMDEKDTPEIAQLSRTLFEGSTSLGHFVSNETELGAALAHLAIPDCVVSSQAAAIGFIHRKLSSEDVYFIANTSNHSVRTDALFRMSGKSVERWNPFTGEVTQISGERVGTEQVGVSLNLAPYESAIFVFHSGVALPGSASTVSRVTPPEEIDLSSDWKVTFPALKRVVAMPRLRSWTDDAPTRYYSGEAIYQKNIQLPESFFGKGLSFFLNFGDGTPVPEPIRPPEDGMRALLESPVREAALVYINGQAAGPVWHPPYEVDVSALVHAGNNYVKISVGNLAINRLAGRPPADYRLLNMRYGVRFEPQDMDNLQPIESGLLGAVRLVAR